MEGHEQYLGMSDHDLLITIATRQEAMGRRLDKMGEAVIRHDRQLYRLKGMGSILSLFFSAALVLLGVYKK